MMFFRKRQYSGSTKTLQQITFAPNQVSVVGSHVTLFHSSFQVPGDYHLGLGSRIALRLHRDHIRELTELKSIDCVLRDIPLF